MSEEEKRPKVIVIPATIPQKQPELSEHSLNSLKERSLRVAAYCRVSSQDEMQCLISFQDQIVIEAVATAFHQKKHLIEIALCNSEIYSQYKI